MKPTILFNLLLWVPLVGFAQQPLVIGERREVTSHVLGERRTVNVYLPDGYHQQDTASYPVIYVIDGGIREDFLHITGIVQYCAQPWIDRFPPSIVVGIETTDRRRDCTFAVDDLSFLDSLGFDKAYFSNHGGSADYIAFLSDELLPFIDSTYRTEKTKTVIGESLAGLLATELLLKHRELFDIYVIINPSLWWGNGQLLREATTHAPVAGSTPVSVYVGACNKAEDEGMYAYANGLYRLLMGWSGTGAAVYFDYVPQETHATMIHQAVYNAFKLLHPTSK